jgi:HD-like signal output (HDOD) protein/CheY-like chemotaxis protein
MRRIMFVDDEQHLLSGLRRMLRSKRDCWDMVFALGAAEALEAMASEPVDVVVSDMKMPRMDGAQLLAEIRRLYPCTARMILSGHADRASIISAVGPTQQYLTKPCDVEVLVAAIERVLEIRELIHDTTMRDLLGGVESLPKPPQIHQEMMAIAADPECRLDDVVAVIERDLATSAEVLRLVNSSFFGLPVRVDSLARAVSLLGVETIQGLAVAGAVFSRGGTPPAGLDPHRLCAEGVLVATLSKRFAISDGWTADAVHDAFFAGLLHKVGLPVLAGANPQSWDGIRRDIGGLDPWRVHDLEVQAFGYGTSRATAYLLGLWGFGEAVVTAIADQPAKLADPSATPGAQILTVARQWATDPQATIDPVPDGYLTAERLDRWAAVLSEIPTEPEDNQSDQPTPAADVA